MKRIITLLLVITFFNINAQSTKGNLAGKIIDKATSEEIIGATVVVEGTSNGASTDLDGKFFMKLDPGTYTIVVSYVSYKTKKYEGIEIKAGELTPLNVSLDENSTELEEVIVQGETRKETAAGLLLQQKNAVSMSSGISAELIRKMPDRTTADIIKRVSGASVQDGKFAIIRGLGDRYNYGMINGAPLPSSETDRKAFSLDIVPAQVVDNMVISKTATPDMPGDFAGGIIQINTKDIPDENTFFVNVGSGVNTRTTFADFYSSPQKGGAEFLGIGSGARSLPSNINAIPYKDYQALDYNANGKALTDYSRSFNNNFVPVLGKGAPNYTFQLGGSKRMKIFGNDFGVIGAITYNNANKNIPTSIIANAASEVNGPESDHSFNQNKDIHFKYLEYTNSRNNVNTGGILNFTYKAGQNSKFFFKNLITSNNENNSYIRNGQQITDIASLNGNASGLNIYSQQYVNNFSNNRMNSSQFSGEHVLPTSKIKFKYILGYNNLYRSVPDYKYLTYRNAGTDTTATLNTILPPGGGNNNIQYTTGRFFSTMKEYSYSAGADVVIPFFALFKNEFKVGGLYQYRSRDFASRQFSLSALNNTGSSFAPNDLFQPQNLSSPGANFFSETTQNYNNYQANASLAAGFVMLESRFTPNFRAIYGLRVESYHQHLSSLALNRDVDTTWTDLLPSVNLIYALTETMNLRASYSKTVSRPEFREFAPLNFYDINVNAIVVGNKDLTRALINNFDVKYEIFPAPGATFSVNPFLKLFDKPIELKVDPGSNGPPQFTYINGTKATNYGIEFEARFSPIIFSKTIPKVLENFTLYGNYALIKSSIDLSNVTSSLSDVTSRPLQGQSPYVLNAGIQYSDEKSGWDFTLAFNQVGRRIAYVSPQRQYLIWENPRLVMDISITKSFYKDKFKIRAIGGDLLAQDLIFYCDVNNNGYYDANDVTSYKYKNGQTIALQAIYNF